jgi:starvation-inducible DNA-binding protein
MTTVTRPEETGTMAGREESIARAVSRLLADTYATYLKTLYYHWNVTGPHFRSLHLMFEEQYVQLQEAMDVVAERVRQLGANTPAFGRPLTSLSAVADDAAVPEAMQMVRNLVAAHEAVAVTARFVVTLATEKGDVASADIATERIEAHEKAIWMLRATVE